jgi:hypothetical protein
VTFFIGFIGPSRAAHVDVSHTLECRKSSPGGRKSSWHKALGEFHMESLVVTGDLPRNGK